MDRIKSFIKKNHIIAYLIIMAVLVAVGYCVKWYHFPKVAAVLGGRAEVFYAYFNVIHVIVLLGATAVFFGAVRKLCIEKMYIICGIVTGILFMLAVTPFASADEDNHFYKCYDISNTFFGYSMPENEKEHWLRECDADTYLDRNISVKNYWYTAENFFSKADGEDMVLKTVDDVTYDTSAAIYYFPAILGISLGRVLHLGTVPMLMLARIMMLAVYILITYFAIKKIPVFKPVMALVMLMPSVMARAASVSQDGLLMAYTFVFIAYAVYYIYTKEKIKAGAAAVMVISGLCLTVGKGGAYIPFLLLLFLIPRECFGTGVKYPVVVASSILLCLGAYILCDFSLFADIAGSAKGAENDLAWTKEEGYTIRYIITHPLRSFKVLINTFFTFGGVRYAELIGSGYGWLQIYTSEIWVGLYTLLLFCAGLNVKGEEYCLNAKQKVMSGAVIIFSSALVILSMWIFWTPLSMDNVVGIQGRYFVPMLLLGIIMFKNRIMTIGKKPDTVLILLCMGVNIGTIFNIWTNMLI